MPQISFCINDKERKELFDFLILNEAVIIPEKQYLVPEYSIVKNVEEFFYIVENETGFFHILSPYYSQYKLVMDRNRYFEYPAFYIEQRYGGPYIDIVLFRGFADDAEMKYKQTDISYYPRYIKLQYEYEEFKATDELKVYYNRIVKFLKSKCKQIKVGNHKYWVSKEVIKELNLE